VVWVKKRATGCCLMFGDIYRKPPFNSIEFVLSDVQLAIQHQQEKNKKGHNIERCYTNQTLVMNTFCYWEAYQVLDQEARGSTLYTNVVIYD
jgi:hypothetical protein